MKVVTTNKTSWGAEVVCHTLYFDDGKEVGSYFEVFKDGSGNGPIDSPRWGEGGRVHNWRGYVDDEFINHWDELSNVERILIYLGAEKAASNEEWD